MPFIFEPARERSIGPAGKPASCRVSARIPTWADPTTAARGTYAFRSKARRFFADPFSYLLAHSREIALVILHWSLSLSVLDQKIANKVAYVQETRSDFAISAGEVQ